jgi:hypothetical protein
MIIPHARFKSREIFIRNGKFDTRIPVKLQGVSIKKPAYLTFSNFSLQMQSHCKVSDLWRLPHKAASEGLLKEWNDIDANLHAFLAKSIPEALQHTGAAAFDEHLLGVQAVLRHWGAHEAISKAGQCVQRRPCPQDILSCARIL